MTREEALSKVKGYLTDLLPIEEYDEVEEILKALGQEIPKGATNGDMFVAVWGHAPSQLKAYVDWWNSPYKKGDK
jgi:hypothetical protein